jgi:hypothetical protein
MQKRSYNTTQAADYLGVSPSYLRQARMDSKTLDAPPATYITPRKPVYLIEDMDAWLDSKKQSSRPTEGAAA